MCELWAKECSMRGWADSVMRAFSALSVPIMIPISTHSRIQGYGFRVYTWIWVCVICTGYGYGLVTCHVRAPAFIQPPLASSNDHTAAPKSPSPTQPNLLKYLRCNSMCIDSAGRQFWMEVRKQCRKKRLVRQCYWEAGGGHRH